MSQSQPEDDDAEEKEDSVSFLLFFISALKLIDF